MGFIMDGLDAEAYDRTYTDRQLFDRIFQLLPAALARDVLVAGTIVLNSMMEAVVPLLIARGIDTVASGASFTTAAIWLVGTILALRHPGVGL